MSKSKSKPNSQICIDVGGTKILTALFDADHRIRARHKAAVEKRSTEALMMQIETSIAQVLKQSGAKKNGLSGIALGVPGVVENGVVVVAPNVPLTGVDLRAVMQKKFGVPIVVGNDASLGTLGESTFGACRGVSSCYGIFVGTGIGGGLVLGGQLIEGARGLGGEIAHLLMPLGGNRLDKIDLNHHMGLSALCGREAIENYLRRAILEENRTSVLTEIIADGQLKSIRGGALKKAMQRDDALVSEVLRRCSYVLGLAAASVSHLIDPQTIVFGGGVIEACGKWMLPLIRETTYRVALPGSFRRVEIVQSELGDDAILWGGLAMLNAPQSTLKRHSVDGGESVSLKSSAPKNGIKVESKKSNRGEKRGAK